ncbi:unnamed protein product [Arabis nemorensis]|uniref:Lipid desaturase domain-containing protein n=1 Tax=Arabis nemorensis TaxID=586526 RepID=A0A565CCH3_9BRAS|nr:unnamed protein product [Arabis nemorensis]
MALPLQTNNLLSPITNNKNIPRSHHQSHLRVRVTCSVTNTNKFQPNREKLVVKILLSTMTQLYNRHGPTAYGLQRDAPPCLPLLPSLSLEGSGVDHWAIDNYGDESTPLIGTQIEAAQGHHKWPWTITKRQFANHSHALARGITLTYLPLFHAWAHESKCKLPPLVVALQDMGLLLSRKRHVNHHGRPPYKSYCIVG